MVDCGKIRSFDVKYGAFGTSGDFYFEARGDNSYIRVWTDHN